MKKKKAKQIINILNALYNVQAKYCVETECEYFEILCNGHISILNAQHTEIVHQNSWDTARWLFNKCVKIE